MDESFSSVATRHALTALTYQYMQKQDAANLHQATATHALRCAVESHTASHAMHMMVASMLLCMFEVNGLAAFFLYPDSNWFRFIFQAINFDSSDLSWSFFFCGAKQISKLASRPHQSYSGDEAILMDWILYHDVMYKFSIRHWQTKNEDQIQLASQEKNFSKAIFSPDRQVVSPVAPFRPSPTTPLMGDLQGGPARWLLSRATRSALPGNR